MNIKKKHHNESEETMSVGDTENNHQAYIPNFEMKQSPFKNQPYPVNIKTFAQNCLKLNKKPGMHLQ